MEYLVKNIDQFVDDNRRKNDARNPAKVRWFFKSCFPCLGRFLGNYIVVLYIIVKIIYILNTGNRKFNSNSIQLVIEIYIFIKLHKHIW